MITNIEKDQVLSFLCENCPISELQIIPYEDFIPKMNTNNIRGIMDYFKRKGLISDYAENRGTVQLCLLVEANDYLVHGGFTSQEELLRKNIEKLTLELDTLKSNPCFKDDIKQISSITSIIANISTALGLFLPHS